MIRLLITQLKSSTSSTTIKTLPQIVKTLKSSPFVKQFSTSIPKTPESDAASQFSKDIIVYKNDNPKYYRMINIFTISQFLFWGYMGHWSFTSLRNTKIDETVEKDENVSWFRKVNLGEDKYKYGMAATCFVIAYVILFVSWTFILRSVRYLVYSKDGKLVSLVTYTPFGKNRILTVPLNCICAEESRQTATTFLPLKVKNRKFFYILDMKGEFKNKALYDREIGLKRNF